MRVKAEDEHGHFDSHTMNAPLTITVSINFCWPEVIKQPSTMMLQHAHRVLDCLHLSKHKNASSRQLYIIKRE
jgi:hypothetical protein